MNEKTLKDTTVFDGHLIRVHVDDVELDNGQTAKREIVDHPGGVSVAVLTAENELLFVKQFRCPYKEVLMELPAGKLEKGEEPRASALRELAEETGLVPGTLTEMGCSYSSPGILSERIYLYFAKDLTQGPAKPDDGEFVETLWVPYQQLLAMAARGEIQDGKTLAGILKASFLLDETQH